MAAQTPVQVTNGTIVYLVLSFAAICFVWFLKYVGHFTKDHAQYDLIISILLFFINVIIYRIGTVVCVITGFATWLMWLCAWMHQWHPLITPEWAGDE